MMKLNNVVSPCGCELGTVLCADAEYLWARASAAWRCLAASGYLDSDLEREYNDWRACYDAHMTGAVKEATNAKAQA